MMDEGKKNGNAPAFPCEPTTDTWDGLTKREYFAAMAMQAMISKYGIDSISWNMQQAISCADALLAELAKTEAVG